VKERGTIRSPGGQGTEDAAYLPLPASLTDPRRRAGAVFDAVADLYDKARPRYPRQAVDDLARRASLSPGSRVLEVGCGTGQLTADLAAIGCALRCLEPGVKLAALARRNLAGASTVEVVVTTFEAAEEPPGAYDAVVSATAFHWVDPTVGFPKAATLLADHGTLALLTNSHAAGGSQQRLREPVSELHRRLAPEVGSFRFPSVAGIEERASGHRDIATLWAAVDRRFEDPPRLDLLFEPPVVSTYPWLASYDRPGYLAMLASQSSYALMDQKRRDELLAAIGELIDEQLEGRVTKQYVTVLATARRRAR
jgi:SAM-dependent methyltransferase